MDKMSQQLNKTENELAECQGALDKQTKINEDLARKVSETGPWVGWCAEEVVLKGLPFGPTHPEFCPPPLTHSPG